MTENNNIPVGVKEKEALKAVVDVLDLSPQTNALLQVTAIETALGNKVPKINYDYYRNILTTGSRKKQKRTMVAIADVYKQVEDGTLEPDHNIYKPFNVATGEEDPLKLLETHQIELHKVGVNVVREQQIESLSNNLNGEPEIRKATIKGLITAANGLNGAKPRKIPTFYVK